MTRRERGGPSSCGEGAPLAVEARDLYLPIALDGAYPATFKRLRAMFRMRGLTPEDAADLAQEAAARAILHLRRRGQDGDELDPLLNRIARNLLIDRARSAAPRLVSLDDAEEIGHTGDDPSEEVSRRQVRRAVRHAIRELPARHRTAITFSLSGMTPAQVAERMGIRRNAADALLHRARRSLAERLRAVGHDAWGVVGVLGLRIRVASRRLLDQGRTLDSASATVVNAVATVALVSTIAFGAPRLAAADQTATVSSAREPVSALVQQVTSSVSHRPDARVAVRPVPPARNFHASVEPGKRVRAQTPTPTGCFWVDFWNENNDTPPAQNGSPWVDVWDEGGSGNSLMPGCG